MKHPLQKDFFLLSTFQFSAEELGAGDHSPLLLLCLGFKSLWREEAQAGGRPEQSIYRNCSSYRMAALGVRGEQTGPNLGQSQCK